MSLFGRLASAARIVVEQIVPSGVVVTESRAKALPPAFQVVALPEEPAVAVDPAITLDAFWNLHQINWLKTRRSSTLIQNIYRYRKWIGPQLGHLKLVELTPPRIGQYVRGMRANSGLAPQTQNAVYTTLTGTLSLAVSLGFLESNPCSAARRFCPPNDPSEKNKVRPQRWEDIAHARALLYSPLINQHRRDEYAGAILLCTRRGELHGLRWKCVHLDAPTPYVLIEKSYNNPTKTKKTRNVPIHPELAVVLERKHVTLKPGGDDIVFPNEFRGGMQVAHSGHHFHETKKTLGLPDIVFHALRKTGSTLYRLAGVPKQDVADILGHSKTVTDVYAPMQLAPLYEQMKKLRIAEAEVDAAEVA